MSNRYKIDAVGVDPSQSLVTPEIINLTSKDLLEERVEHQEPDVFGVPGEGNSIFPWIRQGIKFIFAPVLHPLGMSKFGIFAIFVYFITILKKLLFFLPIPKEPFLRGWRLEVVRRVALGTKNPVPGMRPDLIFRYFYKGLVLIIMRYIYFFPLLIVGVLSGAKMLNIVKELVFYLYDKVTKVDSMGFAEFLSAKVIPQAGIEILIQLVMIGLYVVLVWPVYRLIMIQYALKLTNGFGFLDPEVIRRNIGIFRQHTLEVYGIYGFVVALDVFVGWFATVAPFFTLGIFWLISPIYYLLMRHWVKGFAYGILGKRLIAAGTLQPKGVMQEFNGLDSEIV